MKTSEFKKRVEELGYQVESYDFWITVSDRFGIKATVFTEEFRIALSNSDISLMKLCLEYTETPISEREEEKKYYVVLPDGERESYLDIVPVLKRVEGRIIIVLEEMRKVLAKKWFHLTEKEIKRNHEYLWQFAKEVAE